MANFNKDKAFEASEGFLVEKASGVFSGSGVPSDSLDLAPNGSIYLQNNSNGDIYKMKNNKWELITEHETNPEDKVVLGDSLTIEDTRNHVVMNDMCIDGDLIINGTLGVI